jgi:hypothetical protein
MTKEYVIAWINEYNELVYCMVPINLMSSHETPYPHGMVDVDLVSK